jgi:4-hydroxy-2-oxoheptanedioate aldolase
MNTHVVAQPDRNRFKAALRAHQRQIGRWRSRCSNIVAEVIAGAGFSWIAPR